jgi:Calcineurin-like phosphoesterase
LKKDIIAIACADIHLSLNPPLARKGEEQQPGGWFAAMARPLKELEDLKMDLGGVPILMAGDLFDRHNPSPELINFAMDHLPEMYAIPGQHDLPFHSYADIEKSAYWTMVKHERIHHIDSFVRFGPHKVTGFGWGRKVEPTTNPPGLNIALVHEYTWMEGAGYLGAPHSQKVCPSRYDGYDTVIIGDNHISWESTFLNGANVFNCGGFYRRKSDEVNHRPRVGLIHSNGSVESHYLDCSKDILVPTANQEQAIVSSEVAAFVARLRSLQGMSLDYREELVRAMRDESAEVRKILVEALG